MASGGSKHAHERGDALFITNNTILAVGDLVAIRLPDRDWAIVHRIMEIHNDTVSGEMLLLTKGDDNGANDRGLYPPPHDWIQRNCILGKVVGIVRGIGMVPLMFQNIGMFWLVLIVVANEIVKGRVGIFWWVSLLWFHVGNAH